MPEAKAMLRPVAASIPPQLTSAPMLHAAIGAVCLSFTAVAVTIAAHVNRDPWWVFGLAEAIGFSFQLCGLVVWSRREAGMLGPLMLVVGTAWYLGNLQYSGYPPLYGLGYWLYYLALVVFFHIVLVYPSGRFDEGRTDRVLVSCAYALYLLLQGVRYLVEGGRGRIGWQAPLPRSVWADILSALALVLTVLTVIRLTNRRWFKSRAARHSHRVVWWVLIGIGLVVGADTVGSILGLDRRLQTGLFLIYGLGLVCLPAAFAVGVLRERVLVADVVETIEREPDLAQVRNLLATKLDDPQLEIGLWSPDLSHYLDPQGGQVTPPLRTRSRTVHEEQWGDQPLAFIAYDAALDDQPHLLSGVLAAIRLVLTRARHVAELRAQQRRILHAVLDERAAIAQDLHDAMQFRMYGISRLAQEASDLLREAPPHVEDAAGLLSKLHAEILATNQALRDTAQRIYPAILTERGLSAAVEEMTYRAHIPVVAEVEVGRLPAVVEATAYFLVAGALANAVRHGQASVVIITGRLVGRAVLLEIKDDGIGGAALRPGGGLTRSVDRVKALHGSLALTSPPNGGTVITVELPCV